MLARSIILVALAPNFCATSDTSAQTAGVHVRIGVIAVGDSLSASAIRGVKLGAAEAAQTAHLFGSDVELFEATGGGADALSAAASLLARHQLHVLIGASADDADRLSRFAEAKHVVFLNVSARNPALRSACRRYTFHVEASDAMYAAAARMSRPPAGRASAVAGTVLWSPTLSRFGASELNKRFQMAYGRPMDGSAWAGWFAVKMISEAALRTRTATATALLAYLTSGPTQFDGHKGWPLSFRERDHQLRQPLYVATASTGGAPTWQDVPDLRALNDGGMAGNASRILDRLNSSVPATACAGGQKP